MNDITMMLRRIDTMTNGKTGEEFLSFSFCLAARKDTLHSKYENGLVLDSVSYASNTLPAGIEEDSVGEVFSVQNGELVPAVGGDGEPLRNSSGGVCYNLRSGAPLTEGSFPKAVKFTKAELDF